MKHTISVLVENHFGVLARVSSLFSARGYNIDSLCVGTTVDESVSRITVVVDGDERVLSQIVNQLQKLVEVIEVVDLTQRPYVERELVMAKVAAPGTRRSEIIEIANIFRAKVCDIGTESMIVEVTGSGGKVEALVDSLRPYGIEELVRTGRIAMLRSQKAPATVKE